jgi:hypothetical protein
VVKTILVKKLKMVRFSSGVGTAKIQYLPTAKPQFFPFDMSFGEGGEKKRK